MEGAEEKKSGESRRGKCSWILPFCSSAFDLLSALTIFLYPSQYSQFSSFGFLYFPLLLSNIQMVNDSCKAINI